MTDKITEGFIRQQPNDDWVDDWCEKCKKCFGSHLSKEEHSLFVALYWQDLTQTKTLLEQVQNINAQAKYLDTWTHGSILHYIVKNSCNNPESGWIELLEEVLSKYSANNSTSAIDVNITSELDYGTSLCVACRLGNLDIVNILLKHRADPNVHTIYPPLHYTLGGNKIDIAKVLLEHGAEAEKLNSLLTVEYSKSAVEMLLPHLSYVRKDQMLHNIATDNSAETDHDIEIAELLLNSGVTLSYHIQYAEERGKNKLAKLFYKHKENTTNNSSHSSEPV